MKEGWAYKRIDEVCSIARGGSPRPIKKYITNDTNGLNWIKIGDTDKGGKYIYSTKEKILPEGLKKSRWVEEDEFLLSNSMSFGRPYILKTNGCIHDGWLVLRDYQKYLNIDFFYYVLSSENVQRQFRTKAQGSTVSNLNTERVASVIIPVPSLSEQEGIVERLDAAFAQIDELKCNAEKQLAEARALFQSALTQAMQPKSGWEEKTLKEITTKIGSGATPKGGKAVYIEKGVALVRSMNVHNGFFKFDNLAHILDEAANLLNGVELKQNDVLFNITGASIARCCVLPDDVLPARVNQHVAIIRPKADIVDPRFLSYVLISKTHQNELLSIGLSGATRQALTKKDLENHVVSLPLPNKQKEILDYLDNYLSHVRELEEISRKTAAECDALKQALLRQIFE